MRAADKVEQFRLREGPSASSAAYGMNGAFVVALNGATLRVIASDGGGWDHVSVSLPDRCPTWDEMQYVRRLFFRGDEVCMQLHPRLDKHISFHPFCLHLWRPQNEPIPLPPTWMVGPMVVDRSNA